MPEPEQTEQVISEAPDKLKGAEKTGQEEPSGKAFYRICLTALGVVFGDTYYVGAQTLIPGSRRAGMAFWREALFAFMARNAARSVAFYSLPPQSVMGVGIEVEL